MLVRTFLLCVFAAATAWPLAGCGPGSQSETASVDTTDTRSKDLMQLTNELPGLSRFHRALDAANFREMLELTGPYTVFAPLDAAFLRRHSADEISMLSPDTARAVVSLHVVRGLISDVWNDSLTVSTVSDVPIRLMKRRDGQVSVAGHRILQSFQAQNGLVHVIPNMISAPPSDTTDTLAHVPVSES